METKYVQYSFFFHKQQLLYLRCQRIERVSVLMKIVISQKCLYTLFSLNAFTALSNRLILFIYFYLSTTNIQINSFYFNFLSPIFTFICKYDLKIEEEKFDISFLLFHYVKTVLYEFSKRKWKESLLCIIILLLYTTCMCIILLIIQRSVNFVFFYFWILSKENFKWLNQGFFCLSENISIFFLYNLMCFH